jgi:hypothetical protein
LTFAPVRPAYTYTDDAPQRIIGASESEIATVRDLYVTWAEKRPRNVLRSTYYDGTVPLRTLGISIPPALERFKAVLGWPEKAVRQLAARNIFDGFVAPGQDDNPFDLSGFLRRTGSIWSCRRRSSRRTSIRVRSSPRRSAMCSRVTRMW